MDKNLENVAQKAAILIDALPYIRDFSHKVIVIEYGCGEWLSGVEERNLMKDIVLLKSVGMRPIVVHDTPMGVDKFRENKRIAKLLELCGVKAIGICGVDMQTLNMTMDNDYIPVIEPNDIDNEAEKIDPLDTALEIAEGLKADKLVYLCSYSGIYSSDDSEEVIPRMRVSELEEVCASRHMPPDLQSIVDHGIAAVKNGVNRAHILNGRYPHVLLIEFFGTIGAGTAITANEGGLYAYEEFQEREAAERARSQGMDGETDET